MNNLNNQKNFVESLQSGDCSYDDINTFIDKWHDEYDGPMQLYEYLGMTKKQYDTWLVNSDALPILFPIKQKEKAFCMAKKLVKIAKDLIDN